VTEESAGLTAHHQAERLSHALYGLIIVSATLVAEQEHINEASEALVVLLSTGLVLLLAHTYSAYMAERMVEGHPLGKVGRRLVVADNLPVILSILFPGVLFVLAGVDAIGLQLAYRLSIAFTIVALFGLGVYEGRTASMGPARSLISGISAAAIGLLVITVEALFD